MLSQQSGAQQDLNKYNPNRPANMEGGESQEP